MLNVNAIKLLDVETCECIERPCLSGFIHSVGLFYIKKFASLVKKQFFFSKRLQMNEFKLNEK